MDFYSNSSAATPMNTEEVFLNSKSAAADGRDLTLANGALGSDDEEDDLIEQLSAPRDLRLIGGSSRRRHQSFPGEVTLSQSLDESALRSALSGSSGASNFNANNNFLNGGFVKPTAAGGGSSKPGGSKSSVYSKNSKKSRNGVKGRGFPKKVGGGGRWTWGKIGSELEFDGSTIDEMDPNYDSESQEDGVVEVMKPVPTEDQLMKITANLFNEYLENCDAAEFINSLPEYNLERSLSSIVPILISRALERRDPQRELTSVLLRELSYSRLLQSRDVELAFDTVIKQLDDLSLDTPDAPEVFGKFIARAVADKCLDIEYINSFEMTKIDSQKAKGALYKATVLLKMRSSLYKLDSVWAQGGGARPVRLLSDRIELMLSEYVLSGDIEEVGRCIKELDVPHFHHEFIYQAVYKVLEDPGTGSGGCLTLQHHHQSTPLSDKIVPLFVYLTKTSIVAHDQLLKGFERIYEDMPDIVLDAPSAYTNLEKFVPICFRAGFLPKTLLVAIPRRMRRRFISESMTSRR